MKPSKIVNFMKYSRVALLFSVLFVACYSTRQQESKLQQSLTGEWRNTYLKVIMNSFKNSDTPRILEVNEANWEEKLKGKTIRTFYKQDGTYNSEHRNLKDSIVYNPAGRWMVSGDSLYMTDTFPKRGITYRYKFKITADIAEFWGIEDFDQDGREDDGYYGRQRKQ